MTAHVHVIPVDPSLTPDDAWKEICIFGQRVTKFLGRHKGEAMVRTEHRKHALRNVQVVWEISGVR